MNAKYEAYKDSEHRWLGVIPEHWKVVNSRRIFRERKIRAIPSEEQLTASQKYGVIPQSEFMELEGRKVTQVLKGHEILKHVDAGDFVISMRSFQGGLELSEHSGSISSAYVPIFPLKWVDAGYFKLLFKTVPFIQALQTTSDLVRDGQALRFENLTQISLPVPPLEEQEVIASQVSEETARIDALIEKKTRFIELLKEKRQALITQAVTKGLDPNVPMRDSGVEWIGEVPEGWDVTKVRYLASKIGSGKTPSGGATTYVSEGVIFLRSQNIYDDGLRIDDVSFITSEVDAGMAVSRVRTSDVLLNITGGSIGRSSIVPADFPRANVNQHVCIVRPQKSELSPWVHLCFCSAVTKTQVDVLQTGSGREGLNFDQVGNFVLAVPPMKEIPRIMAQVEKELKKIDSAIALVTKSTALLRERRSALITAAVTGQIDLRTA